MWSRFADQHGYAILCPTWDNGEWWQPAGQGTVSMALKETLETHSIDDNHIYLAGYSNGGIGGWSVLASMPRAFRGYICISGSKGPHWRDTSISAIPVLLIHGRQDRVVPISPVEALEKKLIERARPVQHFFA